MSIVVSSQLPNIEVEASTDVVRRSPHGLGAYLKRNPKLIAGLILIGGLLLFAVLGAIFVDTDAARPMSARPSQPPSAEYPFGTDDQGRDLLAVAVVGLPLTMQVGLIAGVVAIVIGTVLGLIAGYVGGWPDMIIRGLCDILMTVPGLVVLITVASSIQGAISVQMMALVVASLAWMWPARTIRSQVLTLRERAYVQMAKLSGMNTMEVIFREIMPNLMPFLAASFVGAVSAAILASIGLEALGLGPQNEPTLGMTIYWAISFNAVIRGMWWWLAMPIGAIVILFIGLFLIIAGLDEIANPRLRKVTS
ncbi:MAG TPA: ABC transporter permease [Thermomicrobiales bacterium]|nr:ABC transporter permease [Thermomicrobiales bacterium]